MLRIEAGLRIYFSAVAFSTAAFFLLVIALTLRLRKTELTLMRRIGCSPFPIASMVGVEISLILSAAAALAALGTWVCVLILRAGLS